MTWMFECVDTTGPQHFDMCPTFWVLEKEEMVLSFAHHCPVDIPKARIHKGYCLGIIIPNRRSIHLSYPVISNTGWGGCPAMEVDFGEAVRLVELAVRAIYTKYMPDICKDYRWYDDLAV